eukprot:CAMPEP_0117438002 /NCGR_PEP_ID=MMETSP0759-20121206/1823_1 /TAXON_ID=63605 /ORGANISM="Percolomonas cosmopolitus, Strain WS" /LENGTH=620 /DNA_ID=CAMNT_0005229669 /DNA_START=104 /DNA_END=1963 /DNA_ORIENTATION=-
MSAPPLNASEIRSIKRLIDQQLRSKDIYSQIRSILSQHLDSESESVNVNSEEHVLNVMRERGVLQQLVESLHQRDMSSSGAKTGSPTATGGIGNGTPTRLQQLLHLKIVKGKAFLEFDAIGARQKFCVCVQYGKQRFQTQWLDCHVEPTIDEDMLLVLNDLSDANSAQKIAANVAELLQRSDDKIHIIVIKEDEDGQRDYIGGTHLEWRKVLKTGLLGMSVELGSSEMTVPRGILELRLELLPRPKVGLSESEIQNQFNIERSRRTKAEREFYLYSKQWFEEYRQIRPSHKNRVVKIYAECEAGGMKPVTSFVYPLRADRLIDSPSEAARFVSLISYERNESTVENAKEIWWETHTFLSKKKGDFENHAILLCSLLLGFGMDAYVCVGTDQKAGRLWVMTRSPDGEITFWESVTGARYKLGSSKSIKYQSIGCVFNHESFFANIQRTDDVTDCQYDLENERHWKSMSRMKLSLVPKSSHIALAPSSVDCVELSSRVENELKEQIMTFRRDLGLTSAFDTEMSYMLSPAIFAYEQQRLLGGTAAVKQPLDDFNDCIKNKVTEGHTFKAFPLQITNTNSRRIMSTITKNKICMDILKTQGDMVRFGLRVRAFSYPDDIVALW